MILFKHVGIYWLNLGLLAITSLIIQYNDSSFLVIKFFCSMTKIVLYKLYISSADIFHFLNQLNHEEEEKNTFEKN